MRKKYVFTILVCLFLSFPIFANAGGTVISQASDVYSTILHKNFSVDEYRGQKELRWILIQTNIPYFNEKFDYKKFHKDICESFVKNGWEKYLLAKDEFAVYRNSINLGNDIYVYRKQPKIYKHKVVPIVNYSFDTRPDIEINFMDRRKLTFKVTIPEIDLSEMWNTFKYRGEPLERFFNETVVGKYEDALKYNNHYK